MPKLSDAQKKQLRDAIERVSSLMDADTDNFTELFKLSGLPVNIFRGRKIEGYDFRDCDISYLNLKGAEFINCMLDEPDFLSGEEKKAPTISSSKTLGKPSGIPSKSDERRSEDLHEEFYPGNYERFSEMMVNDDLDGLKLYVEDGADISWTHSFSGDFPLLLAARLSSLRIVEYLLHSGADVNQVNVKSGTTPLLEAVKKGFKNVAELLLRAGADVNATNSRAGAFPLLLAILYGHQDCAQVLIDAGANVDQLNLQSGHFPLLVAVSLEDSDSVSMLLNAGANVDQQSSDGKTALGKALSLRNDQIKKMLLEAGAKSEFP